MRNLLPENARNDKMFLE